VGDQIIIGIVVIVTLGGHWWLFQWVKFKMDEGVIMKFLQESDDHNSCVTEVISSNTSIAIERVSIVCNKSKVIKKNANENESWRLNGG
jgi:Sec7-like guanine-nucleotide exchange factor